MLPAASRFLNPLATCVGIQKNLLPAPAGAMLPVSVQSTLEGAPILAADLGQVQQKAPNMKTVIDRLNQNSSSFRVLIVDDEPDQRALCRAILQPPKYEVVEAADGNEALELVATQDFDVVVLDKRLPGLDGEVVCHKIRNELGNLLLPIIMVTGGGGSTSALTSGLRAGASDFLHKPYSAQEFAARIDGAISRKRLTDQLESAESVLFTLARMVEAKDGNTGDHCTRLAQYSVRFGQALGLNGESLLALRRAGVMHDIGKLGIPEAILLKPGSFTPDEWNIMKTHTVIGERLCGGLKSLSLTVPIIRSHHERWDGSGYPDGLLGEEIPLLARVFQICDIYDALSFARPYKPALPTTEVRRILLEETERGWRDPTLVEVFLGLVDGDPDAFLVREDVDDDLGRSLFDDIQRAAEQSDLPSPLRDPNL